jgi:outer membrane lipoprotein-sorting protein
MSRALCLLPTAFCLVAACAPRPPLLPTGTGAPFPDFATAYQQATSSCRGVKTLTASIALSGKAGKTKVRGRVDGGFAAPARVRLEGIAPFGKPVFVLVADAARGTLVLPREDRVLRDAPPDQIVEALAGVRVGPDALRSIVAGCGFGDGVPGPGVLLDDGASAPLAEGKVYLRRNGTTWELLGATRDALLVLYSGYASGRPATIRLIAGTQGAPTADLTLRLSDVEINTTLDPKTFEIDLPAHPVPVTLEELRRAGPLGGS